mmetsp:Transcript_13865/g.35942  ORF Transcript_13865/g.35942 Transcript_13865/m.35942 type:complete len:214 (+) Transcript_13865:2-643(+)
MSQPSSPPSTPLVSRARQVHCTVRRALWAASVLVLVLAGWLLAIPADADCASCAELVSALPTDEHGWTTRDGRQYRFSGRRGRSEQEVPASFAAAHAACAAEGGHLASLHSAREEQTVRCLIGDYSLGVWIGLSQPLGSTEPTLGWQWDDGQPVRYSNWAPGMPDHGGTTILGLIGLREHTENCARIGVGGWYDELCDPGFQYPYAYVCERPV